ncbi:MAG: hypothetical protein QOF48_424 [Verrucomicrobiota bacterium]
MDFIKWTGHALNIGRLELPIPLLMVWGAMLLVLITGYAPGPRGRKGFRRSEQPVHYWLICFIYVALCCVPTAMVNMHWLLR